MALRDRVIEVLKKWCGTDAVIGATRSWKTSGTEPRLDFRPRFSNFVEMICETVCGRAGIRSWAWRDGSLVISMPLMQSCWSQSAVRT